MWVKNNGLPESAASSDLEVVDKAASFEKSSFGDREGEGLQGHGWAKVDCVIKIVVNKCVKYWTGNTDQNQTYITLIFSVFFFSSHKASKD